MTKFNKFQYILVIFLVGVITFYGGYYFGVRGYEFEVKKNPPEITVLNKYPGDQEVDFELFWQVWDIVGETYLERPVDPQVMLYGAIEGMVSSLGDPYTSYLPPEVNESVNNSLNGNYEGIGAELAIRDGSLIVVAPLDGSPAEAAGVRAGDEIIEIEGESTFGMSVTEAVTKIRGEADTNIALTLRREGGSPFVVNITRGLINIDSVSWEDLGEGNVYIRVSRFGGDTNGDWQRVVSEVNTEVEELDAIILDLRGNPGGYLASAEFISSEFFTGEPVVIEENALGEKRSFDAERVGAFEDIPAIYVLIDGGSASASEIVAAALRSNAGAVLVGEQSFGKGSIQDTREFSDGSGVHITVKKWLTPDEEWIHNIGLAPDHVVERTSEDVNNGIDAQLDKAIELANQF